MVPLISATCLTCDPVSQNGQRWPFGYFSIYQCNFFDVYYMYSPMNAMARVLITCLRFPRRALERRVMNGRSPFGQTAILSLGILAYFFFRRGIGWCPKATGHRVLVWDLARAPISKGVTHRGLLVKVNMRAVRPAGMRAGMHHHIVY